VRQEDHIHVAGLTTAIPELTIAHAQVLLAIPMKAFRASPAITVNPQNSCNFPISPVGNEDLLGSFVVSFGPEYDNSYGVIYLGDANAFGEVPLPVITDPDRLAVFGGNLPGDILHLDFLATENDFSIELKVRDIAAIMSMDVIEVAGIGEPAVEGKIAGDVLANDPIHHFPDKFVMIMEDNILFFAPVLFDESPEIQRIVFAGGADIVGNDIIMGDLVTALAVVPEVPHILNELSSMIDKNIVDWDDSLGTETRCRVPLEPIKASLIESLGIPGGPGDPPIKARLIGRSGEFTVNCRNILAIGHNQASEIFREVDPFGLVGKQMTELIEGFFDDRWEFHDSWHDSNLHTTVKRLAIGICRQNSHSEPNFSILQKSRYNTAENYLDHAQFPNRYCSQSRFYARSGSLNHPTP